MGSRSSRSPDGHHSRGPGRRPAFAGVGLVDLTGPECVAFEQEFAAWVGAREAVAVSSCTAALELSLRALDLPAGARVLMPTITFCGVASAVIHAGLVPVLADVDPFTATMSPATASAASPGGR